MEFLVLNKSVNPSKVSRLNAESVEEAAVLLGAKGIANFSLYSNISDGLFENLFTKVVSLEKRLEELEISDVNTEMAPKSIVEIESEQLRSVELKLRSKKLVPANPDRQMYEDTLEFRLSVENTSGKLIRATKGNIIFSDLFGADIFSVGVTINEHIRVGSSILWNGAMPYNQFIHDHVHFAGFKIGDLTVRLADEQIVFDSRMEL